MTGPYGGPPRPGRPTVEASPSSVFFAVALASAESQAWFLFASKQAVILSWPAFVPV